ncbi:LETM1-like protein [Corchorus olitorius]|uniref:LETM1-like protein n=1 Tax=Corchorus olitorius TaxID=93759 RepID=A0A1R3H8F6_9ROSI|nr:LETM1-like protein [Corchorus olitorius]
MSSSPQYYSPTDTGNGALVPETHSPAVEFNRVNCLVWVLHESARSFSHAVESLEMVGSSAELAMAWNGKDVHRWHRRIAHRVAVYALLKTAIELEILLSQERHYHPSPVRKILTQEADVLEEFIESQLKLRHSELLQWFKVVELPRIAGFFIPLLKKWSMEYAGSNLMLSSVKKFTDYCGLNTRIFSGVAGIIVAVSCCAAVEKLGSERTSCPLSTMSVGDIIVELMNLSLSIVSIDKLHQLATEAGFEHDFLHHFGAKVLRSKRTEELEFWIGLAHRKLSIAFCKEIENASKLKCYGVKADSLATLGLFAYLGRRTRLFFSLMRIKDLDEQIWDFLSYLECGSLFICPEFSSISAYQSFMEVVTDEIGWLDFYDTPSFLRCKQEKRRQKQHTIQAEKEMILSEVFTACYDVFSGFAHFSRSAQQPLDSELLAFLLRSQSLLTICLEDYWSAYDRSSEPHKITESGASKHTQLIEASGSGTTRFSVVREAHEKSAALMIEECQSNESEHDSTMKEASSSASTDAITFGEGNDISKPNPLYESLIRKYSIKLISTTADVWLGTQLLCIDIMASMELLLKQLCGQKLRAREKRKLKRTFNDIATLIPVTILMLIPVSAVGHAAILTVIKKYMPSLIPSPYSSERLGVAKQLKRTKKMEVTSWSNLEDPKL